MGQAELQRPHCSQKRNISMALKRSANFDCRLICFCLKVVLSPSGLLDVQLSDAGNKFEIRSTKLETNSNVQKEE
jgi:hypothetical protein